MKSIQRRNPETTAAVDSLVEARRRFEAGDPAGAAALARVVARRRDAPIEALMLWGVAAAEAGDFNDAIGPLSRVSAMRGRSAPGGTLIDLQLGRSLAAVGRWREGLAALARVETIGPSDPAWRGRLGAALAGVGKMTRALPHLEAAAAGRSASASAQADLAWALVASGAVAEAEARYERAIQLEPSLTRAHAGLAALKPWSAADNHIERLKRVLAEAADDRERVEIGHALFKELDDLGERDSAWNALTRAHHIASRLDPWSAEDDARLVDALIERFAARSFRTAGGIQTARGTWKGPRPIFVVGLPRTGTTLLDRILSAHSRVASLGEPPFFPLAFKAAAGQAPTSVMTAATVAASRRADWARVGGAYLREAVVAADGAAMTVDKLPFNSLLIGAIRLALPQAKIILVERDAMDALWSAHRSPFALGGWYGWSRRLDTLAAHYVQHRRLMDHWRGVLGDGLIEVCYEDLVRDPDATIRRLLAVSDLEPEDACFRPHEVPGPVFTLSQNAVRTPIGVGRIGRWRAYADKLEPLRGALFPQ